MVFFEEDLLMASVVNMIDTISLVMHDLTFTLLGG